MRFYLIGCAKHEKVNTHVWEDAPVNNKVAADEWHVVRDNLQ